MSYPSGVGAATVRALAFGAAFVDADNDSRPDIVTTNGHVVAQIELTDSGQTYAQTHADSAQSGTTIRRHKRKRWAGLFPEDRGPGISIGDYDAMAVRTCFS